MKKITVKKKIIVAILCIFAIVLSGCVVEQETIANNENNQEVVIGEIYTLNEAYDNGYIDKSDLLSIAYHYHALLPLTRDGRAYNEDIMDEDFVPQAMDPLELDDGTKNQIKKTLTTLINSNGTKKINEDDIKIGKYYGTYNGGVAIVVYYSKSDDIALDDVMHTETVQGVNFCYNAYTEFSINNYDYSNAIVYFKTIKK